MYKIDYIKNFVYKRLDLFVFLGLAILFYFNFFHNIGEYALMDVDETRYVLMARDMFNTKDFMTLYLNNEYFFEKPPLYFWGECLSFAIFGKVNEFTARFPVALYGTLCCYLVYFIGKKIVSRSYGVISSLILATSLEFLILAKFAILDIVVSTCVAFSLCFGLCVYFCRESHRKYYWWLFYLFSALAVMAKGLPGFIVPFGSMFFISIISKRFKDVFKPQYFIVGSLLFLLIVLPWHVIMLKTYNPLFWDEYIVKHHLARFIGSKIIDRKEPVYFYIVTLLWGFFPWVFSIVSVSIKTIIKIFKSQKWSLNFDDLTNIQKFLLYNVVISLFIFLFFSSSGTKLITYILPIYIPLSFLGGYVWKNYIENGDNSRIINTCNYFLGILLILASICGILTPLYLPSTLLEDIAGLKLFVILSAFAVGLSLVLFTKRKLYKAAFVTIVLFMMVSSAFATKKVFDIDYKFGQYELMNYTKFAEKKKYSLTTFDFGHKYSLLFYGDTNVTFDPDPQSPTELKKTLRNKRDFVIVRNKDLKKFKNIKYRMIHQGRKYALLDEVK